MVKRVGVLALQGDFIEHIRVLERIGALPFPVRKERDLEGAEALVIPGGESTTILTLMKEYGLSEKVKGLCLEGMPCLGTCAGLIILSGEIADLPDTLGLLNVRVKRNAYGRQRESFEDDVIIPKMGEPFRGVFIRAPKIVEVGEGVEVLGRLRNGEAVLVRQGNIMGATFHPELVDDTRIHEYFLREVRGDA